MTAKWDTNDMNHGPASLGLHLASTRSETESRPLVYQFKHRVSCHRCGNMRKTRRECVRCPHVYCHQCEGKMLEQFGLSIFKDGCPVCKELCCCGKNRSFTCPHAHHCYKKCPSTKRHSYKTATGFATASKRCMKSQMLLREIAAGHSHSGHSDVEEASSDSAKDLEVGMRAGRGEHVRRSARISQLYSGHHKPIGSYAEIEESPSELSEQEQEQEHGHIDGHESEGETSCAGSDSADHSHDYDDHHHHHHHHHHLHTAHHDVKRGSSAELLKGAETQPAKLMRVTPQSFMLATPAYNSTPIPAAPLTAAPQALLLQQQQSQPQHQPQMPPTQQTYQQPYDWSGMLDIDMRGLLENFGDWDDDWLNLDEAELQSIF